MFIPLIDASPAACLIFIFAFLGITEDKSGNVPIFKTPPKICDVTCNPEIILVDVNSDKSFCVLATDGIVIAVDLNNQREGRKAEKIIKKLPAFHKACSLGNSGRINQVDINKRHIINLVTCLDKANIKINKII